jgi:hypothetical protein
VRERVINSPRIITPHLSAVPFFFKRRLLNATTRFYLRTAILKGAAPRKIDKVWN